MLNLAPIFYMEKLGCTETAAGAWIAMANSTTVPFTFLSGLIESVLLKRGRSQLWIRKASTAVGTVGVAASVILCKPWTLFAFS